MNNNNNGTLFRSGVGGMRMRIGCYTKRESHNLTIAEIKNSRSDYQVSASPILFILGGKVHPECYDITLIGHFVLIRIIFSTIKIKMWDNGLPLRYINLCLILISDLSLPSSSNILHFGVKNGVRRISSHFGRHTNSFY